MLLKIFKTSQPLSWFLIVILIIVLRLGLFSAYFNETHLLESEFSTPSFLYSFNTNYTWVSHIISTIIVLISSLYFNQITQKLNILKGINYLIMLFTGLFLSFQPQMLVLSPVIITAPILLFSYPIILKQNKDELALDTVFNASFIIGLSSLVYFPSVTLFFILLISLIYLNQSTWRHFIIGLIGWSTPWLFHDVIVFVLYDSSMIKLLSLSAMWQPINFENYYPFFATVSIMVIILFQSMVYLKASSRSIIRIQKALNINFWYVILGLILTGFLMDGLHNSIGLIVFPTAILFAVFHLEVKKWWVSDLLIISLFGALFLNYLGL